MSINSVIIKEAGSEELDEVVRLIRLLYDQEYDAYSIEKAICSLDSSLFRAWIAFVGDEPVGLTSIQVRALRWPDRAVQAGYWGNLYVRPEYRKLMIYPRLVFAMLKGASSAGIDLVFTGTRRPHVAEAHRKIGFQQIGTLPVLLKPLRPFRLLTKHKLIGGWAMQMSKVSDGVYAFGSRFRKPKLSDGVRMFELQHSSHEASRIVDMLNMSGNGRISQIWSVATFNRRFEATIDKKPYTVLCARRKEEDVASIIYCQALRGNHIRVCVIADLVFRPGEEESARALIAEVENRAHRSDGDCVLFLDGLGGSVRDIFDSLGYHVTHEIYHMLVWPKERVSEDSPATDLYNWRFTFSDHDAF